MNSRPVARGAVVGRFLVVHNDHVKVLAAAKALCRHLVVGITDPDPFLGKHAKIDAAGYHQEVPFTFFERLRMLQAVAEELEWGPREVSIVPFPLHRPELHNYYIPRDTLFFETIYNQKDRKRYDELKALGFQVRVLWEKPPEKRGLSASEILQRMKEGEPWEHLVSRAATAVIKRLDLPNRLSG